MKNISQLKSSIKEDFRFLKGWITHPGEVGAIKPTGEVAARAMASAIPHRENCPVLELGPGTGVITKQLLELGFKPEQIFSIEYNEDFYELLCEAYPGVNFIAGDAFDLEKSLADFPDLRFSGVIGAVPLLNVPKARRIQIICDALDLVINDGPFVQISYGPKPPIGSVAGKFTVEKLDRIYRNIPPAGLWIYRKDRQASKTREAQ